MSASIPPPRDYRPTPAVRWAAWYAVLMTMAHAVLWIGLVLLNLLLVPRVLKVSQDFALKVPIITEFVFAIANWLVNYWYILPPVFLPALVADGALMFFLRLRPETRKWGLLWSILVFLAAFACYLVLFFGLLGPWIKLHESLSK